MRLLAFILSVYILALNFAPCEDSVASDNPTKTEITQHVNADHQHGDFDLCSPFCQCHCCHGHVTYTAMAEYTITPLDIPTNIFHHFEGLGSDFKTSLLQPPRV